MRHPIAVFAVLVLFANDHFLKHAWPGFVTGKVSDIAGMIFFPLLLAELAPRSQRLLAFACIATGLVFALTKTMPWANDAYRDAWGLMQAPFRGHFTRVVLVRDPTDLLALPFLLIPWSLRAQLSRCPTDARSFFGVKDEDLLAERLDERREVSPRLQVEIDVEELRLGRRRHRYR